MDDDKGEAHGSPAGVPPLAVLMVKKRTRLFKDITNRAPNDLYLKALLETAEKALVGKIFKYRNEDDDLLINETPILVTRIGLIINSIEGKHSRPLLEVYFIQEEKERTVSVEGISAFLAHYGEIRK
jgi:hypothetical protein